MKKRYWLLVLILSAILVGPQWEQSVAQDNSCPAIVETALAQIDEVCGDLARNEACYGNSLIEAVLNTDAVSADVAFDQPADRVPLEALQTLRTYPMDEAQNVWGVAVMNVQANLPDTLPGQAVSFILYGDVELENAASTDPTLDSAPCPATVIVAANVRSGPSTNYNVVTAINARDTLEAKGRNEDGAWLFVDADGMPGWISADLVAPTCDVTADLVVYDPSDGITYGPMQAFSFSTGFGEPSCEEMPPSSLVIQSPEGYAVTLNVNGLNVTIGSTVAMTARPDEEMTITTLRGQALLAFEGETRLIPEGFMAGLTLGGEGGRLAQSLPDLPNLIEEGVWRSLENMPASLLPERIHMPDVSRWENLADFCEDRDNLDLCDNPLFQGPPDDVDCADPENAALCGLGLFTCGDNVCDLRLGETPFICPEDCGGAGREGLVEIMDAECGDDVCNRFAGENRRTCPADCRLLDGGGLLGDDDPDDEEKE